MLSRLRFDRKWAHARRYRHILGVLMKYGFEELVTAVRSRLRSRVEGRAIPGKVRPRAEGRTRPERLRLALEEMGPTFIKLGQLLSTRPDLVPREYIAELERLQDRVAPDKQARIVAEAQRQLGRPLGEIFARFDPEPLASGSIAQVHRATTVDGEEIVLKIRRPGIVGKVRTECEILRNLAGLLRFEEDGEAPIDAQRMVQEFTEALMDEVDLAHERQNLQRFVRNFRDDPTVHVPRVYEAYCADGVLAMEYIDGLKPGPPETLRRAGLDPGKVAKRGADFVLRQIFDFGFFHTDPHPGNFFLLEGDVVSPLDFGQVARLSDREQKLMVEFVLAIVDRDIPQLVRALARNDMLAHRTDPDALTDDLQEMLDAYYDLPLHEIPFRQVIGQGFDIMRRNWVRPPAEFTLMLKCLMTIESLAVGLDPQFDILAALKPYARRFAWQQYSPSHIARKVRNALREAGELAGRLPDDLEALLNKLRRGQFELRIEHEHLDDVERTMDRSSNRISFALIIAALLVGSSMLVAEERMIFRVVRLQTLGVLGYLAAAIMGLWLLVSILRGGKL